MRQLGLTIFCLCLITALIGQDKTYGESLLKVIQKDTLYHLDGYLEYFPDKTRTLTFEEVLDKTFYPFSNDSINSESLSWYSFKLQPKIASDSLMIRLYIADEASIYVPMNSGYNRFTRGKLVKQDKKIAYTIEMGLLSIATRNINFSKPFYLSKNPISSWGIADLQLAPSIFFTDDGRTIRNVYLKAEDDGLYIFLLGITFISSILFLVNFWVTGDKSFLIYSLYLFFVTIYYGNRLPAFMDLYNDFAPRAFFYINQTTHIANIGLYTLFVMYFLNFKENFKSAYAFTRNLLWGVVAFGFIYTLFMFIYPYFPYRILSMEIFRIAFTVLSFCLFIYLMFQKPDLVAKVILIGSLLLIIGNAVAVFIGDFTFFLKMSVVEIVIFSGIVSYKNQMTEKARLNNKYALEIEKKEKKALLEIDNAKSTFFENISHEFRTPLTLIKSPIENALNRKAKPTEKVLKMIARNTNRLDGLIDDLLSLSKLQSGKMELKKTVQSPLLQLRQICAQFQSYAEDKKIDYKVYVEKKNSAASYDKGILEKIVTNLVSNALKYTPSNGKVNIKGNILAGKLYVEVKDNGIGLSKEDQNRIFERFYRGAESGEYIQGSGIGLSLVKELVNLHGGDIQVSSELGNGSTFTLLLNLEDISDTEPDLKSKSTKLDSGQQNAEPVQFSIPTTNKPLLLLVEDNDDLRFYLGGELKGYFEIVMAKDGEEGWKKALEITPEMIVSDWMMPKMDGIELCKRVKQDTATSHIPFIMLTAKSEIEAKIQGYDTGADAYVGKPFDLEVLMAQAKNMIRQRRKWVDKYKDSEGFIPSIPMVNTKEQEFWDSLSTFLRENLNDADLSSEKIAASLGMSRMQLHRKLKALTNFSTTEFVRKQRLKQAIQILKESDISVNEVAYTVGFNTPSYFIKCFKETYKKTPLEYLQSID